MSGRPTAILVGVAALAILIGGCGGGDDTTAGDSSAANTAELTKAELIKQADTACAKQNEELSADFVEFAESNTIQNGELSRSQSEEFSEDVFFPYVEGRIEILNGYELSAADEKQVDAIVSATEDGLATAKKDLKTQSTNAGDFDDPLAKAEAMSRKFGFQVCGET